MPERTPAQIRESVRETRQELEYSIGDLQAKVNEMTNWRRQLVEHRRELIIGAAVAGFVVGGGVAAVFGLFKR
jgi:hypothetical protein